MTNILTPFDAEKEKAKVRLAAKQAEAEALAKRARNAVREARKAAQIVDGLDRKKRDRARYIVGGIQIARMTRGTPDAIRQWLDNARMNDADRALVQSVLEETLGPLSMTAAPEESASMADYPSLGSAANTEHRDG